MGKVKRFTLASLALACLLSGCGASRMERMTMTAGALHGAVSGTGRLIDRAAEVKAEAALAACEEPGETCEREISDAVESLRPAQASQHLVAAAVDAFVEAVITAAMERDPDWTDALRHLGSVMDLYEQMRVLLAEYGIDAPQLPAIVLSILGEL